MFWVIVAVYVATAALALVAVASAIGLVPMPFEAFDPELRSKLVWALWASVLAETAGLFFLISRDSLGLSLRSRLQEPGTENAGTGSTKEGG